MDFRRSNVEDYPTLIATIYFKLSNLESGERKMVFNLLPRLQTRFSSAALNRNFAKIPKGSKAGFQLPIPYTLDQLVKLELLTQNDGHQIKSIWDTYHATKRGTAGKSLYAEDFVKLRQRAQRAPLFAHALTRTDEEKGEGYFVLVSQYSHPHHFLFAQLEHFQKFPDLAQPYLVLRLYDDLLQSKQVALLRADSGHTAMTTSDCKYLLDNLITSYLDDAKYEKVKEFNDSPDTFDLESIFKSSDPEQRAPET